MRESPLIKSACVENKSINPCLFFLPVVLFGTLIAGGRLEGSQSLPHSFSIGFHPEGTPPAITSGG